MRNKLKFYLLTETAQSFTQSMSFFPQDVQLSNSPDTLLGLTQYSMWILHKTTSILTFDNV